MTSPTLTEASSHMTTASGLEVDLRYPRTNCITLADISHHLAQINRFVGACRRPYSVAEHSLLVLDICQRTMHMDVHGWMAALMHDAHEAYTNDVSTPAKAEAGDGWAQFEGRMERTVRAAFALHTASHRWAAQVKQADLIALATERAQLLPPTPTLWPCLVHVQPATWVDLMAPERCAMTWADWRQQFADQADALDFARNDKLAAAAPKRGQA
jgi:hypothetical protein